MKILVLLLLFVSLNCYTLNVHNSNYTVVWKINTNKRLITILHTIRYKESTHNYQAIGKKGEIGAYQFMKTTWKSLCLLHNDRVLIPTKENQDIIARHYVTLLINKGYTNSEIASVWNCGKRIPNNSRTKSYIKHFNKCYNTYNKLDLITLNINHYGYINFRQYAFDNTK